MTRHLAVLTFASALVAWPCVAQTPVRDTLRMVFVGDINFARSLARNYLFTGRGHEVFAGVRDRLRAADIAVGNLESILLERGTVSDTNSSPVFAGPQALAIPLLLDAGFDVIGTANNHAWDFGRAGLLENIRWLDSAGVAFTGTGASLGDAWRPVVIRAKGWTIAFFSITAIFNNPYSLSVVGHESECCVAWADTNIAARRFAAVRDSVGADLIVAYIHAGLEYKPYPEPDVVRRFRALARAGADLVIGHHPHVPQGIEYLDGKPIVYSLGNFVFMQRQRWTNRGLWADVTVVPDTPRVRLSVSPLAVGYTPSFLAGRDSAAVMTHVDSIARLISPHPRPPARRPRTTPASRP